MSDNLNTFSFNTAEIPLTVSDSIQTNTIVTNPIIIGTNASCNNSTSSIAIGLGAIADNTNNTLCIGNNAGKNVGNILSNSIYTIKNLEELNSNPYRRSLYYDTFTGRVGVDYEFSPTGPGVGDLCPVIIGTFASGSGQPIAIGCTSYAGDYSIAIGENNMIDAPYSIGIGPNNIMNSNTDYSVLIGGWDTINTDCIGDYIIGQESTLVNSSWNYCVGWGSNLTNCYSSYIFGEGNEHIDCEYITTVGKGANVIGGRYSTVIGHGNKLENSEIAVEIGYDCNVSNGSNCITFGINNNILNSSYCVTIGNEANVSGTEGGIVIGRNSSGSGGTHGIGIGHSCSFNCENAVSIGTLATVIDGLHSIAIGKSAEVTGSQNSIAIGNNAKIQNNAENTMCIGTNAGFDVGLLDANSLYTIKNLSYVYENDVGPKFELYYNASTGKIGPYNNSAFRNQVDELSILKAQIKELTDRIAAIENKY